MPRTRRTPEPPIYLFRVRMLGGFYAPQDAHSIWREIAVASNQTLSDLGKAIPLAFDFDDPHLWSFFLSGKPWDTASEYALQPDEDFVSGIRSRAAKGTLIRDVPFPGKTGRKEFLFLFDFGDEWHFGVKLLRQDQTVDPKARYPQVVASKGVSPPQYPDYPEDEEEAGFIIVGMDETDIQLLGLDAHFQIVDGMVVPKKMDEGENPSP